MKYLRNEKDISGCAIAGIMSETGRRFPGEMITESIACMRERSSGLGGGFAAYGIYPENQNDYAFHVMFEHPAAQRLLLDYLAQNCIIIKEEPIPTEPIAAISSPPILRRYFLKPKPEPLRLRKGATDDDMMAIMALHINRRIDGAFVLSSGKNMGIFKGVGYPEDIARFFRLNEYEGYIWLAHGRFPTNTTGWWGGAHPFGLLDWALVHNGEISSYGINKRYLENFDYHCSLHTDTEVITYLFDLLVRKQSLPLELACRVLAPPFWSTIEMMDPESRGMAKTIRIVYGGALLNGPFSVAVGHAGGMIGLNDRTKLRPMIAARSRDLLFIASEESAIRKICARPDSLWHVEGGEPVIGEVRKQCVSG